MLYTISQDSLDLGFIALPKLDDGPGRECGKHRVVLVVRVVQVFSIIDYFTLFIVGVSVGCPSNRSESYSGGHVLLLSGLSSTAFHLGKNKKKKKERKDKTVSQEPLSGKKIVRNQL